MYCKFVLYFDARLVKFKFIKEILGIIPLLRVRRKRNFKRISMPKMKTVRGAAKRFKVGKNKIKRGSAFRSHILTKKSRNRKRDLRSPQYVDSTNVASVKAMLGI